MRWKQLGIFKHGAPTKKQWAALLSVFVIVLVAYAVAVRPWHVGTSDPAKAAMTVKNEQKPAPPPEPPLITGRPSLVELPELGVRHTVIDGNYDSASGQWATSDTQVLFATLTTQPNNKSGNTFIYGHATSHVFGPILQLQPGHTAKVTTDNGYVFTYRLSTSEVVDPGNTAVLQYEGAPRLTLQTCTGPTLTEFRHLFYFDLIGYEKVSPEAIPQPVVSVVR